MTEPYTTMTVTNQEWKRMALDAVGYKREIIVSNAELADTLFSEFEEEYEQLSMCLNKLDELEHRYYTAKWYRPDKKKRYKSKVEVAKAFIELKKLTVHYRISKLRRAAEVIDKRGMDHD